MWRRSVYERDPDPKGRRREMEFRVELRGNKRVDAHIDDFVIKTDQSVKDGGEESAPPPYALFLASIGTCAGIYVVYFCEARKIPIEGIELIQRQEWSEEGRSRKLSKISIEIRVPPSFPVKYHKALARAAASCAVKKTIDDPPEFDSYTVVSE
jgi:ribosomal protein S12 methylthiotransferase accessory factor